MWVGGDAGDLGAPKKDSVHARCTIDSVACSVALRFCIHVTYTATGIMSNVGPEVGLRGSGARRIT